jgi:peptidoglycan/xylan/chitin deacetylase (PgdA/CDA1 family)
MRVTSHCTNHPSKEASHRCASCGKWLCGGCLQRYHGRVFCGRKCQAIGAIRDSARAVLDFARQPIHPAWAIAIVAGAAALLLSAVGIKVAELVEVSRSVDGSVPSGAGQVDISARIFVTEQGVGVEADGLPASSVLLLRDGNPVGVIVLDDEGHGSIEQFDLASGEGPLQIIPVTEAGLELVLPTPTATPYPTATPEPSPTETPEPAPTDTPRPKPTGTPRQAARALVVSRGITSRAAPTPIIAPPVLQLVQDAGPRIAITFDGNASSNRTAELLDLLQRQELEVTIFVTGQFIERHPSIIRRAVLSGHEVGNHTYSHPHLTTYAENRRHQLLPDVTRESLQRELRRTEEAFANATGRVMQPLWRSPYGEENRTLRGWALEVGYLHVRWSSLQGASLDSHDWVADEHSSLYKNSRTIMDRLIQFPKLEGGIILMHMATEREEAPWKELPVFLDALDSRGLEPTTVTQLLEASPTWRKWLRRAEERHRQVNGG